MSIIIEHSLFHNSCIISSLKSRIIQIGRECTISGNEHLLICIQLFNDTYLHLTKGLGEKYDSKHKYIHTTYINTYVHKYINSIKNTYVQNLPEFQPSSNIYVNVHTYIRTYIHGESSLFYEPDLLFRRRYFRISGACSEAADPSAKVRSPCGSTTSSLNNISMP